MTRFLFPVRCQVCGRTFEVERERAELLADSPERLCGRDDCRPPKGKTKVSAGVRPALPRSAPRSLETGLVHACLELLAFRPHIMAWRQNQGALNIPAYFDGQRMRKKRFVRFADVKGIADIMGLIAPTGRTLAIECKIRPNKLTKEQAEFLERVRSFNGLALEVVDDVMHLDRQLKEAGY